MFFEGSLGPYFDGIAISKWDDQEEKNVYTKVYYISGGRVSLSGIRNDLIEASDFLSSRLMISAEFGSFISAVLFHLPFASIGFHFDLHHCRYGYNE